MTISIFVEYVSAILLFVSLISAASVKYGAQSDINLSYESARTMRRGVWAIYIAGFMFHLLSVAL